MSPLLAKRLSDESLGSRLASGEAAAFDELYRRYVHRLAAYGAHLVGDGAAGDDVAQVTMLRAYGALRDGRVPDRMKPWLYRIAHNVAIDLVMRRREVPSAELPEQGASDSEPVAGALVAALASLPERQRHVYVLRELHGLRIDETAAELALSSTQVEQSLFAARNRLAEHLVFGDRLNCVAVQRLASGPLDADERRALKNHLRSCAGCRGGLGMRGRALSVLPVTSLEWLRGLVAGAAGGGAPVVAKVGAVVATVTVAAGVPVAVETAHHAHRARLPQLPRLVMTRPTPRAERFAARAVAPSVVSRPVFVSRKHPVFVSHKAHAAINVPRQSGRDDGRRTAARPVSPSHATEDHGGESADVPAVKDDSHEGHGGGDTPTSISSSDGSHSGRAESDDQTAATVLTAPVTSHDGSGTAKPSGDSGGDSGSGSGDSGGGSGDSHGGGSGSQVDSGASGSHGGDGGSSDLPASVPADSNVTD